MLMYDLTNTRIFTDDTSPAAPTDCEMLALTVALLLVTDTAYRELDDHGIVLTHERIELVAACIEERLPPLDRDTGHGQDLRMRLADLEGMRIASVSRRESAKPC